MGLFKRWAFNLLFFSAVAVYMAGFAVDIMEIDAAQYASLSREMAETGDYLQIHHRGKEYLDKPPLLFWVTSFWIELFGPNNWTYKISSFLFSIIGVVSTYKLGHLLYNKRIGFVAAIMLASSQAYFLFNHDVRTDTILTGAVIFGVWQIMAYVFYRERWHLIGGFIGIALGMMAKGPIALMIPMLAFGSYFIGRKRYKDFLRKDWLLGIGILAIMLAPMTYGLYRQFDAHPEKEITFLSDAGNTVKTDVSGVKFFYWTQSFGRITGENVWKDGSPPTFFIDTFLWAFLPWSLLGIWAILWRSGNTIIDIFKGRKKQEWLTLGGFILPFIAFSTSSYKLPHYIFVLFPFASIITAEFVLRVLFEKPKWWRYIMLGLQSLIIISLVFVCLYILIVAFPDAPILVWLGFLGLMGVAVICLFSKSSINQIVLSSALAIIAGNWVMNMHFYPELFEYQPSKKVAQYIEENHIPKKQVFIGPSFGFYSLEYYADHTFYDAFGPEFKTVFGNKNEAWIYVNEQNFHWIEARADFYQIVASFPSFHISMINREFLDPKTRESQLKQQYLVKIWR